MNRSPGDPDLETMLLGPVVPARDCGDCTACCTHLTVNSPDFAKPAGVPCSHLTQGGCGIHAVRPRICRTWFCVWRRRADLPDAARPDRSGLLISLNFVDRPQNRLEAVSINIRMLPGSDAIRSGLAAAILDRLCTALVPVWFSDGDEKMLMHPAADVARHVLSDTPPPASLAPEVAAWRERYAVFDTDRTDAR
ncbi:MAG: YkgJ family cysteine cluster protein [Sphingomonas paucimobilis]